MVSRRTPLRSLNLYAYHPRLPLLPVGKKILFLNFLLGSRPCLTGTKKTGIIKNTSE